MVPLCNIADAFLTDFFGINSTYIQITALTQQQQLIQFNLEGTAGDPIAAACPEMTMNTNASGTYAIYLAPFDDLSEYATSVYAVNAGEMVPVAAKYQNGTIRRVITGFNFAALPNQPSTARPIETVANAIVD